MRIRLERETRKTGGIRVDGNWYPSDLEARLFYLELKDEGRDMLATGAVKTDSVLIDGEAVDIETLDGVLVNVTIQKAIDLVAAGKRLTRRLIKRARIHRDAMMLLEDPTAYDYSGGWPAKYEE